MANLTGIVEIYPGDTTIVDTTAKFPMLTRGRDSAGCEYIYLTGVASTVVGSWVTYDELGITTLLVANAIGSVAVAQGITVASTYGWYCIFGSTEAKISANSSADVCIGFETTAGCAGDGKAAGDMIYGAVQRDTVTTAAVATVQLSYPFVTDESA